MIPFLKLTFIAILIAMLWVTTTASLDRGVFLAVKELWPDPWFKATLFDAYFSFLTIYLWVAYRERHAWPRIVWFALFMGFGSMAAAVYILIQLFRLRRGDTVAALFSRRPASSSRAPVGLDSPQ
ncbi:MAG: DUF1475 family protein [Gammaproteobacteria bacterium]